MSSQAAKRRRRDIANYTLTKPFRSPVKKPLQTSGASSVDSNSISASSKLEPFYPSKDAVRISCQKPDYQPRSHQRSELSRKLRRKGINFTPKKREVINNDPEISSLLRIQRDLEKQLGKVNEDLDTAEQAKKIELESCIKGYEREIDGELRDLISKWTLASRQAAEELFSKVQDRVNRMGGPRAWKEMEKRRRENFDKWDQEGITQTNSDDHSDTDDFEKRDIYAEYSIDPETDIGKSQRVNCVDEFSGEEDDFTMAMMLKTMNIDLDVIGYDRDQQQWID